MKFLIIGIIFGVSVFAGEMDRIEAIVKDIENLREEYSKCKVELDSRNTAAEAVNSEKSNNKLKELVKIKEKENKVLINQYEEKIKIKDNTIKSLENKIKHLSSLQSEKSQNCHDDNKFPKLIMKDEIDSKSEAVEEIQEKEESIEASAFRLNKESDIYDSVNGNVIYRWEDRRSFTSSVMTQNWIKITGYFIDKEWVKADEELWIEKVNTLKR